MQPLGTPLETLPSIQPRVVAYNVRYCPVDMEGAWKYHTQDANGIIVIPGAEPGVQYIVEAQCVPNVGQPSDWVRVNHTVAGKIAGPPVPGGFTVKSGADTNRVSWTLPTKIAADLEVEVEVAPDASGAPGTWSFLDRIKGTFLTDTETSGATLWYRARSIDYQGNTSAWTSAKSSAAKTVADGADVTADNIAGSGVNICHPLYSNFELPVLPAFEHSPNVSVSLNSAVSFYGDQSIRLDATGSDGWVYFGQSATDYNVILEPNKKWIFSFWYVWSVSNAPTGTIQAYIKTSAGNFYSFTVNGTVDGAGHQASGVLDLTADGSTSAIIRMDNDGYSGAGTAFLYLDGIQVEQQIGNDTTPSAYVPPPMDLRFNLAGSPRWKLGSDNILRALLDFSDTEHYNKILDYIGDSVNFRKLAASHTDANHRVINIFRALGGITIDADDLSKHSEVTSHIGGLGQATIGLDTQIHEETLYRLPGIGNVDSSHRLIKLFDEVMGINYDGSTIGDRTRRADAGLDSVGNVKRIVPDDYVAQSSVHQYISGSGVNICHPLYSNFETANLPAFSGPATAALSTSESKFGAQSLKLSASAANQHVYFGQSVTDYNVILEPNKKWIFSFWYNWSATNSPNGNLQAFIKTSAGNHYSFIINGTADGNWHQASGVLDLSADGSTSAIIRMDNDGYSGAGTVDVYLDGIQLVEQVGTDNEPSGYVEPPSYSFLEFAGSGVQTGDHRNLPFFVVANGQTNTIAGISAPAVGKLTVASGWSVVGGNITMGSGPELNITGLSNSETYYVYADLASPTSLSGATGGATTSFNTVRDALNRVFVGTGTTTDSGGSGGGGSGCVTTDMLLVDGVNAGDVKVGDKRPLHTPDGAAYSLPALYAKKIKRLVLKVSWSDDYLLCTPEAPLFNGENWMPAATIRKLQVRRNKKDTIESVTVEEIGKREIVHLSYGGHAFLASAKGMSFAFHHNKLPGA